MCYGLIAVFGDDSYHQLKCIFTVYFMAFISATEYSIELISLG